LELRHFFDVGASIGRWSSRVSQDFPNATFDLFEPLIDYAPAYREKMATTLARHPGFRLHKMALGAERKRARMYVYPANLVGSTALALEAKPVGGECIEVDMLTLDYAIQEFQLPTPNVIKMDVQGCELSILQGGRQMLPKVDVLLLECWLARAYGKPTPLWLEIADWLREFDFHVWDLGNGWRDTDGTLVAQDFFFLNARCGISRLHDEAREHSEAAEPTVVSANAQPWLKRMRSFLHL
jgi:FkbM family methyltransferase